MKMLIDRFLKHIHNLPEQHKMLVSIGYSQYILEKHFEIILDRYSLSASQYNLLRILEGTYPKHCQINELKDMIVNKKSDVSRMVERLRKAGLIDRCVKTNDRRAVNICINEKGLELLNRIMKQEEANMFGPFLHVSEAEAKQLNQLLQKMLEGLSKIKLKES